MRYEEAVKDLEQTKFFYYLSIKPTQTFLKNKDAEIKIAEQAFIRAIAQLTLKNPTLFVKKGRGLACRFLQRDDTNLIVREAVGLATEGGHPALAATILEENGNFKEAFKIVIKQYQRMVLKKDDRGQLENQARILLSQDSDESRAPAEKIEETDKERFRILQTAAEFGDWYFKRQWTRCDAKVKELQDMMRDYYGHDSGIRTIFTNVLRMYTFTLVDRFEKEGRGNLALRDYLKNLRKDIEEFATNFKLVGLRESLNQAQMRMT
uniref:Uncharacterized protein n=1 Tax=Lotharella globosa TaxID=91324 RepID=A0A7S3YU71_9EUKA